MKVRIGLVVAMVAALLGGAAGTSFAAVTCDMIVTTNITLHHNLTCPSGNGLNVNVPNVTVNLNGFTISTTSLHDGVGIYVNNVGGVTVKNGTIKRFNDGVRYQSAIGGTLTNIHAINNLHNIRVAYSTTVTIRKNTTSGGDAAILTQNGSSALTITGNTLKPGDGSGVRLNGTSNSYVVNNKIPSGNDRGIYLLNGANNNNIAHNTVTNVANTGIQIDNSKNNLIDQNTVTHAGTTALDVDSTNPGDSSNNRLTNNTLKQSGDDGLFVALNATATVVESNIANANTDDGIVVLASDFQTIIENNTANNNGDDGFFAPNSGFTDGGGNTATGNGGTDCVGVAC